MPTKQELQVTTDERSDSRLDVHAEYTSFGLHSTGRPRQIRTLLALLTEYWRLEPALQLHEILERLIPSGALPLDGPSRDDAALIAALNTIPELHETAMKFNRRQESTSEGNGL
jgi:hypothetical protein